MAAYQASLERHLAKYKSRRLGVQEAGVFERNGRGCQHILPLRLRQLNILEPFRAEFWAYLRDHPEVRLHKYFHHLNSSQALAFNLFFPFFSAGGDAAAPLLRSLGTSAVLGCWKFEYVPDITEGTNVDVAWQSPEGEWTFCEVKLSETEFGAAKPDSRHRSKCDTVYRKRLSGLIEPGFLEFEQFCRHYQLLRNVSLLSQAAATQVVFLLPSANEALAAPLNRVLNALTTSGRERVRVAYLESVLASLQAEAALAPTLRMCAFWLAEKYVPT